MVVALAPAAAVLVTLVAVDAVVNIAADPLVLLIGIGLGMAISAGEDRVIAWVGVARCAHSIGISVTQREVGVIPVRRNPRGGVVARGACGWEPGRRVVGIAGTAVVSLVTGVAVRRQGRVIVVDVATGARNRRMRAGQRKGRVVVVER